MRRMSRRSVSSICRCSKTELGAGGADESDPDARGRGPWTIDRWTHALRSADSSVNLRNATFEADEATDVVIDRDDVHRTCISSTQSFEDDFEAEAGSDEETDEEDDQEDNEEDDEEADDDVEHKSVVVAQPADTAAAKKQVAAVNDTQADEARRQEVGEHGQGWSEIGCWSRRKGRAEESSVASRGYTNPMNITLSLDDELLAHARKKAEALGKSLDN